MSLHRRAARRDANEASIVKALRAVGVTVYPLSGAGVPDLLCGYRGSTFLLEVKTATGKATPAQEEKREAWRGGAWRTVRTVDEALAVVGATSATSRRTASP